MRASFLFLVTAATLLGTTMAEAQDKLKRYTFKIDPKTPVAELLPTPPEPAPGPLPWLLDDPRKATEVFFEKIVVLKNEEEDAKAFRELVTAATARKLAKINHVNEKGKDYFIEALCENRPDLAGLPWIKGDACRMNKERSAAFVAVLDRRARLDRKTTEKPEYPAAQVAALMQTQAINGSMNAAMVKNLAASSNADATRGLARLAVFSFTDEVRRAAIDELKGRPAKEYASILLGGLRYPLPVIAKNASHALMLLNCGEMIPEIVGMLDEPDPGAPFWKIEADGSRTPVVREVVRLNHHRNCLLCHAPANTPDVSFDKEGFSAAAPTGPVPAPEFEIPITYYRGRSTPDILVRADVTYLRQDFSMMLEVKDHGPWPKTQRFDFLVRERPLAPEEVNLYYGWKALQGPAHISPNHEAVLATLRGLTGMYAPNATAQAWREALRLK